MTVRLALAGAGLIGRRHAEAIATVRGVELSGIADPDPAARDFAAAQAVPHRDRLDGLLADHRPDGVILATPNRHHEADALLCIAAGLPVLVEKPLADDLSAAARITAAAEAAGVPVAVGHHRRHNPLIVEARRQIDAGRLGRITAVQATFWALKPASYFETGWRGAPGGGPLNLNLIHDIDTLRHLCGPIDTVHAVLSNAARGLAVEDTAALLLTFRSGALGTVSLSDTIPAPWSWELTARENPAYPASGQSCAWIGGTLGALSIPDLTLWQHPKADGWWGPIAATRVPVGLEDPLRRQIAQFAAVIRGEELPLVPAREALENLRVIDAARRSAATQTTIRLHPIPAPEGETP